MYPDKFYLTEAQYYLQKAVEWAGKASKFMVLEEGMNEYCIYRSKEHNVRYARYCIRTANAFLRKYVQIDSLTKRRMKMKVVMRWLVILALMFSVCFLPSCGSPQPAPKFSEGDKVQHVLDGRSGIVIGVTWKSYIKHPYYTYKIRFCSQGGQEITDSLFASTWAVEPTHYQVVEVKDYEIKHYKDNAR